MGRPKKIRDVEAVNIEPRQTEGVYKLRPHMIVTGMDGVKYKYIDDITPVFVPLDPNSAELLRKHGAIE